MSMLSGIVFLEGLCLPRVYSAPPMTCQRHLPLVVRPRWENKSGPLFPFACGLLPHRPTRQAPANGSPDTGAYDTVGQPSPGCQRTRIHATTCSRARPRRTSSWPQDQWPENRDRTELSTSFNCPHTKSCLTILENVKCLNL